MNATAPRLTIITPSLNQGAYLERAILSVLEQDYPAVEYLIIDGGSTDSTLSVIRRYEERLAFWCSEPDQGQSHAINKGLRRARGEIVAYLNADDYYLPGAFRFAAERLGARPAQVGPGWWLCGAVRFVRADGTTEKLWMPEPPPADRGACVYLEWGGVPQPGCFWRREVFERLGYFREDMHYIFDTEFQIRLAVNGYPPLCHGQEVAVALQHPASKTSQGWEHFLREARRFPEIYRQALTPAQQRALRFRIAWSLA
ncbi:MAG: glycosyltransferase, partial [Planctomycetota bacterium]|nr:glycosyltransferase [Planctomycetota bacterium]